MAYKAKKNNKLTRIKEARKRDAEALANLILDIWLEERQKKPRA